MLRQLFVLGFALGCLPLATATAQQRLGDAEARTILAGQSVLFADNSIAKYGVDGSYTYVAANNLLFRGKYSIADGRLCLQLDSGTKRCDWLERDRLGLYLKSAEGVPLRFAVTNASMPQNTTSLCGVPVAYSVYPPAPGVPQNVRAFSGVWVGKWDYGMCSALIVESVRADGSATLIYVNGSMGGEYSMKSGAIRFAGKIDGAKLSNGQKAYFTEYVMVGPNELKGAYSVPRRSARGQFVRQSAAQ